MLSRLDSNACIVCGTLFGSDEFEYHEGRMETGPAYWSDRGLLCSAACSLKHFQARMADGTVPAEPAPEPLIDLRY